MRNAIALIVILSASGCMLFGGSGFRDVATQQGETWGGYTVGAEYVLVQPAWIAFDLDPPQLLPLPAGDQSEHVVRNGTVVRVLGVRRWVSYGSERFFVDAVVVTGMFTDSRVDLALFSSRNGFSYSPDPAFLLPKAGAD